MIKKIQRYVKKHGVNDTAKMMIDRWLTKKSNNKRMPRPIKSLQDDWHIRCDDEDGTNWTEYGFFEAEGLTDEEIQEYVDGMREEIHSLYDCTGREFTLWIEWHRNPCGWISVIHRKGLDV